MGTLDNELIEISIIIPTYNSERTLAKCLSSIRNQTIEKSKIEILIVDGGSKDKTKTIAATYDAIVLENEKKLPEVAKRIGFNYAKGKYGIFIDSDEYFLKKDSLEQRLKFLNENPNIKNFVSTGMISKSKEKAIIRYANYIADPFSQFVYRFNGNNRLEDLTRDYKYEKKNSAYIFEVQESNVIPLFDAAGNMFNIIYAKELYNKSLDQANFVANIFENMVSTTRIFAALDDDFIIHDSGLEVKTYMKKLKWRIKNNLFPKSNEAIGFVSRQKTSPLLKVKKYLFIPYCIFVIPVLLDSIRLVIKNKDFAFLMHFIFSWYIVIQIALCILKKVLKMDSGVNTSYAKE